MMTDTEIARRKAICDVAGVNDIGEVSDGFHTFNGLYEQRMILFAALVKAYKSKAWKSYRHEDGEYCFGGGWFVVGIDTPEGSYTYHYENKYWDMFDCIDLPRAPHWDGHTEADAETRLMSLEPKIKTDEDIISRQAAIDSVKKNTFRLTFAEEQNCEGHVAWSANAVYSDVMEGALLEIPSAQPETVTNCHDLMDDTISRVNAIDAVRKCPVKEVTPAYMLIDKAEVMTDLMLLPSAQPERKWETCFECPLSHGCPKIKGCTNEQAIEYASKIPNDCPLSAQPERKTGRWIYKHENGVDSWECSECGYRENIKDGGIHQFCSACGTLMKKAYGVYANEWLGL